MWPHRVVDPLPLSQLAVEFLHLQRAGRDLIKLLGVSPLGAFDRAVELGDRGGKTNKRRPHCWQACSKSAANSEPPSTCRARMGKGMRFSRVSRNWAAVEAVARVWAWMTSQRETTSRAVNCLKIMPGRG